MRRAVGLLLLISGTCALVLQTAWLYQFRLIFGSSTAATAAVLAVFMGGLGLGNALLGQGADTSQNPLRRYARLEMAISVAGLISPFLFGLAHEAYVALGGQATMGLLAATLVRLAFTGMVWGVPAFLMGGTLPAAVRAATLPGDAARREVGLLYGLNTFGAVLGVLLGTFWLLEQMGVRATLWTTCALNLLNAGIAWWLSQLPAFLPPKEAGVERSDSEQSENVSSHHGTMVGLPRFSLYLIAAVVGSAFFFMELVWYRMLSPILGGTTFTFGLILAVALGGIGLAGVLYPLIFRDRRPTVQSLALTLAGEALFIAIPFALGDRVAVLASVLGVLGNYGFSGRVLAWLAITLPVVFPAAVISGLQFPLLIGLIGAGSRNVGLQVGRAFGCNTAGAIVGLLAGGFGLMTLVTAVGVWKLVVVALVLLAVAIFIVEICRRRLDTHLAASMGLAGLAAFCLTASGPTAIWRHSGIGAGRAQMPTSSPNDLRAWMNTVRRHITWQADGRESSVAISTRGGVGFVVNGKNDGNAVSDVGTQAMLGTLGALLHPKPKNALVIGLGTGESAGWLAYQPSIERVDVVEIEPAIGHVAEICAPLNHDVLRQPKVRIFYNDASEALLTARQKYDLISSEPSNPYRSGIATLYTREFYLSVSQRLEGDGLFLQWLQGYEIDVPAVRMVLATLCNVFAHVEIWETSPADMLLVCSSQPLSYTAADLTARMQEPRMAEALRVAWRTATLEGVLSHWIADDKFTRSVSGHKSARVNTDDNNGLEYRFARAAGQPGGFSVSGLRTEAAIAQSRRWSRLGSNLDWEAVEDSRIAYHAVACDSPLANEDFTGARARRARALLTFQARTDLAAVARIWDSQPKPPRDLCETIAVAMGLAAGGDQRATELMEPLRANCPLESHAVAALLATRQKRFEEAAKNLVEALTVAQRDATAIPIVVEYGLSTALEIAEHDANQTAILHKAVQEPLALSIAEDQRVRALCMLAARLGPGESAEALERLEPYPLWDARLLEARVEAYEHMGSSHLARARRELAEFQHERPESALLNAK